MKCWRFYIIVCFSFVVCFCGCQESEMPFGKGIYTGQLKNNLPEGFGRYQADGIYYEGEWKNGLPHGFGTYCHLDSCFAGQFEKGVWTGSGRLTTDSMTYEGFWKDGFFNGEGCYTDFSGTSWSGVWENGKLNYGVRIDSSGIYTGSFNDSLDPSGFGKLADLEKLFFYEGNWHEGKPHQFGLQVETGKNLRIGYWEHGAFLGEKMAYNSSRVYGIDISRYQHKAQWIKRGRRRIRTSGAINWNKLQITHLGTANNKNAVENISFPISFCFIKSTQGVRIYSNYYAQDAKNARSRGIKVGAYHFFSPMKGKPQADWFLKKTTILKEDLPPVLDVELSSSQIAKMGGESVMFREMQAWLTEVERATGKKPILYVSQRFIEKYLRHAPQKLLSYSVWIARYGEYRPYVKLLFWQLSPFGRVEGINGNVDIDVFNGNQEQFDRYVSSNYTIQP